MPQEHITTVLTAFFAPTEAAIPQANPLIVYGMIFVLLGAVALALWASRPSRRGLGQKLLTPRPDDPEGLPWMPGGDIFGETADEPVVATPASAYQPAPIYQPAPPYQPEPAYPPDPTYQPTYGAPQFVSPPPPRPAVAPQSPTPPAPARNPWSTS